MQKQRKGEGGGDLKKLDQPVIYTTFRVHLLHLLKRTELDPK